MANIDDMPQAIEDIAKYTKILVESFKNIIETIEKSFGPLSNHYVHKRVSYKSKYWKITFKNITHKVKLPDMGSNENAKYLMEK